MTQAIDVTAVLVNYNTAHLLDEAIGALRVSARGLNLQIVIVDNASRDDSIAVLRARYADCDVIENPNNVGFGRANNAALALARGRLVLLLNTDAFVAADTLTRTVEYIDAHADVGVLGVRLVGRDGVLQPSCRYFPTPFNVFLQRAGIERWFPGVRTIDDMQWDHASVRACDWVPGCYYLVRREVIDRVGLFDPRYFLYYEEVDHCRAVKAAGWRVVYYADTSVVHIGGESAKSEGALTAGARQLSQLQIESELLYFRKHHGLAGVWGAVALGALAALMQSVRLLFRHGVAAAAAPLKDLRLTGSVFRRTAWGARATR